MLRMVDGLRFREAEHIGGGSVRYWPADESDVIPMLFGEGRDDVAAFASTLPEGRRARGAMELQQRRLEPAVADW